MPSPKFVQAVEAVRRAPRRMASAEDVQAEELDGANSSFESGVVDVGATFGTLSAEAFEISDALTHEAISEIRNFNFCRSARKSILLSLGVSPGASPSPEMTQDILRPYSKASDSACVNAYMATLLGAGTFRLSRAISRCGWLIGFGALVVFSLMHVFICLRLVEVPQLIQRDVPNATFLAKVFLHRRAYSMMAILSVLSWFGACAIQLQNVFTNVLSVIAADIAGQASRHETPFGWKLFGTFVLALVIVPLSLKTSAKDLQTKASYAVYAMLAIGVVEMTCAFIHGIFKLVSDPPDYHSCGNNITGGLYDMLLAFGGIAILPYVLADMLQPQNARKVVIEATTQIMLYYLSVAMICYFGWADSIQSRTPLQQMMSMSLFYQNAARVISFLFIIKTVTTFPLTFWPLYREVEALLDLDDSPGLQLQLPWAIRRQRFLKVFTKVALVSACLTLPQDDLAPGQRKQPHHGHRLHGRAAECGPLRVPGLRGLPGHSHAPEDPPHARRGRGRGREVHLQQPEDPLLRDAPPRRCHDPDRRRVVRVHAAGHLDH
ncbi:unnamed protein product [Effrenium voratum]|uniref:Amino acid transporter transmembrane domain-containing protein n=1 Tax=Effrenium voratum TaxID=2562239 RepID=A0AA36NI41_9DINO|nr:unnamed protein product [Effrenium voratum]